MMDELNGWLIMIKIFNSKHEISFRVLVLLNVINKNCSLDEVTSIDLFATYGKAYDMIDFNLHGDNTYTFSEITSRRKLINDALKSLVLEGLVIPIQNAYGFTYKISEEGRIICSKMDTDYFNQYSQCVKIVNDITSNMNEKQIVTLATKKAVRKG